ncbi:TetR/AcrR family transcriptional regulator [Porticoccus sp. W117]|uniref:TetR/AcrR family transcriptional regulator n=1 Tax=Porticoccus sp. W117 TaxID=3054777 RepID=UPI0025919521|nr:TetR/AcrR family transcriptional regulator [Porticoccus sp. W117]MDM3872621.1 TetR/AcrR family transcriptional regulator [Porticoccus sp. W117]
MSNVKSKSGLIRKTNESAIVRAAEIEFADNGFKGASMGRIATKAGIPRPNVHYYFKNKDELYTHVLLSIVNRWILLFEDIRPEDDPASALRKYIHAKVMYSKDNPEASRVFANELLHGAPVLKPYLKGEHKKWFAQKEKVIQSWIDQGKMDPIDPKTLMFTIWASTQQYADYRIQIESIYGKVLSNSLCGDIADNLSEILLKGCGLKV